MGQHRRRRYPRWVRERYELNRELRWGLRDALQRACLSVDGLSCLEGEVVHWTM